MPKPGVRKGLALLPAVTERPSLRRNRERSSLLAGEKGASRAGAEGRGPFGAEQAPTLTDQPQEGMEEMKESCRILRRETSTDPEQVRVRGATRDVEHEIYTVWRCSHCGTLNALEPVDDDRIYANYPIQQQRDDFFSQRLLAKRLKIRPCRLDPRR